MTQPLAPLDDEARAFARDAMASDMAAHQKLRGELPTPAENDAMLQALLEQTEQRRRDDPSWRSAPQTPDERPSQAVAEAAGRGYQMWREPEPVNEPPPHRQLTPLEQKIDARVQFLLTKQERGPVADIPSWRERVLAAMWTYRLNRAAGARELCDVVEASSAPFGDWRKDPAKPLIFG